MILATKKEKTRILDRLADEHQDQAFELARLGGARPGKFARVDKLAWCDALTRIEDILEVAGERERRLAVREFRRRLEHEVYP